MNKKAMLRMIFYAINRAVERSESSYDRRVLYLAVSSKPFGVSPQFPNGTVEAVYLSGTIEEFDNLIADLASAVASTDG